jgi:hypothetical protein
VLRLSSLRWDERWNGIGGCDLRGSCFSPRMDGDRVCHHPTTSSRNHDGSPAESDRSIDEQHGSKLLRLAARRTNRKTVGVARSILESHPRLLAGGGLNVGGDAEHARGP